MATLVGLRGR
jgi:hypothetical protein